MKPITVALLLIASVPANYFAFDFASKNIDNIPEAYIPNLPDLSKLTGKNVQYCSSQETKKNENKSFQESSIMERQDQIMQKHNRAIDTADAQIQRQIQATAEAERASEQAVNQIHPEAKKFITTTRKKVEGEWDELTNMHGITKDSYNDCSTTVGIRLFPNGDFMSVGIVKSSGNDRFDDIAFLSIFHTNFKEEFIKIPKEHNRNYRQFNLRFKLNDVK